MGRIEAKLEYLQALHDYDGARLDRLYAHIKGLPVLERACDDAVRETEALLKAARLRYVREAAAERLAAEALTVPLRER